MKMFPVILLSALALAACQKNATVRDSMARGFVQLAGSELVLKQALNVAPGKARVFVQDGGPAVGGRILNGGFDQYRPHCGFEIERVDHGGFTIQPDTFRITRVQASLQPVVMRAPVQVAGLWLANGMDGNGSSAYHEGYHFWLASERQPEVRRMSCYGVYAEPHDLKPPTLQEIREALGGIAEIRR